MSPSPGRYSLVGLQPFLLFGVLFSWSCAGSIAAERLPERRNRTSPGLVLNTGGRHGACDVLTFTSDGSALLAAGDDKVVRSWPVKEEGLDADNATVLRWPIYREQIGNIYTVGLSSDPGNSRLVAAGFGVKPPGMVVVMNRKDGQITHLLDQPKYNNVVWKAIFDPHMRYVIYGTGEGSLWRWDFAAEGKNLVRRFGPRLDGKLNRIRLIAFSDDNHFISVAMDGHIWRWDVRRPTDDGQHLGQFRLAGEERLSLLRVVLSRDRKQLAAVAEDRTGRARPGSFLQVELFRLPDADTPGESLALLTVPGKDVMPYCLAFDAAGEHLAVGARRTPRAKGFYHETDGKILIYDLGGGTWTHGSLPLTYRPEAVAFHPTRPEWLATAGGDNHEICLWDWKKGQIVTGPDGKRSAIRGVGSCLWGVGLSADRHYLGFQEQRAKEPKGPNAWGEGEWRVFDLRQRKLLAVPPKDLDLVRPCETLAGWTLETTRPYEWFVRSPQGQRFALSGELFDKNLYNVPRCYTFLAAEKGPPRLAVGHTFGVSLYELRPDGPRLARIMIGHEGEVMALGPSLDGKILVTAGRDQTVAGWSLTDWRGPSEEEPCHPELGARFVYNADELVVSRVVPGSPAWEMGLAEGDVVVLLAMVDSSFLYNPSDLELKAQGVTPLAKGKPWQDGDGKAALRELTNARPGRELLFIWKHGGKRAAGLTRVLQRPLWKLFPARREHDNAWVLWRWRDFFYDTNSAAAAGSLVGWHVNAEKPDGKPEFLPLRTQEQRLHKPGKVQQALDGFIKDPQLVKFVDLEPPVVWLTAVETRLRDQDLELRLTVRPRSKEPGQVIDQVSLWVNDYRFPLEEPADGVYRDYKVTVPASDLRSGGGGQNRITLIAYNQAGGRAEYPLEVSVHPTRVAQGKVYGLCVGVSDYTGLKGAYQKGKAQDLPGAVQDAKAMRGLLLEKDGMFRKAERADVVLLTDQAVTAETVLGKLKDLARKVTARDTFVLFLAGHGVAEESEQGRFNPATWFYVCANTDSDDEKTKLSGKQLHETLARLRCRKLVFLDTCHSGAVATTMKDPILSLTGDGPSRSPPLVFSACQLEESALDDGTHGIFTRCVLAAVKDPEDNGDSNGNKVIDARELADYLRRKVPLRYNFVVVAARKGREDADAVVTAQHPVVFPLPPPRDALFSKRESAVRAK